MKYFLILATLSIVTFVLHLLWERSHIGLYRAYEQLEGKLPVFIFATLGDVAYTIGAYLFIAALKAEFFWYRSMSLLDVTLLVLVGIAMALFVEYKALALNRWAYTDAMPMIPYLHVGLSPIIQMAVLLPASIITTRLIEKSWL